MSARVIAFPKTKLPADKPDPRQAEFERAGETLASIINNPYAPPFVRKALTKALIDIACHQSALGPGIDTTALAKMIWEKITEEDS